MRSSKKILIYNFSTLFHQTFHCLKPSKRRKRKKTFISLFLGWQHIAANSNKQRTERRRLLTNGHASPADEESPNRQADIISVTFIAGEVSRSIKGSPD